MSDDAIHGCLDQFGDPVISPAGAAEMLADIKRITDT